MRVLWTIPQWTFWCIGTPIMTIGMLICSAGVWCQGKALGRGMVQT